MIDPKSLRIGNLITGIEDGSVQVVDGISNFKISVANHFFSPDRFIPFPISPEWLERLGFEKVGIQYALNEHIWIQAEDNDWTDPCLEVFIRLNPNTGLNDESYRKVYIGIVDPFVHSIQNYIFALTGEELKLKD